MSKILVVDDEDKIRKVIKEYAEFEGHSVMESADGMQAIELCKEKEFDIIIIDVMMPKLDGFSTCKEIKKIKNIPILMLSARGEEYDKLFGFEMGVDDYVVKPFSPKELMARVNVITKRNGTGNSNTDENNFIFGGLNVDTRGRNIYIDGNKVNVTPKEYELLLYLIENNNIALTRDQLLNAIWGYDFYGEDRTVDTHIKMLRNSLGVYRDYIVTLRGVGYKFEY